MDATDPRPIEPAREAKLRAWVDEFWPDQFVLYDEDDDPEDIGRNVGSDIASLLATIDELRAALAASKGGA